VAAFVASHVGALSPLTVREAIKHMAAVPRDAAGPARR